MEAASTPDGGNTPQNSSQSSLAKDATPSEGPGDTVCTAHGDKPASNDELDKDARASETQGDTECATQGDKPAANGGEPDPPGETKSNTTVGTPGLDKSSGTPPSTAVKNQASGGRDTEGQSTGSQQDSPRRDRHHNRDRGRKRNRDSHRFSSSDRNDEAQRKRDFYFYYY